MLQMLHFKAPATPRWLSIPLLAATLSLLALLAPAKAEAGLLITTGDTIGELGKIDPDLLKALEESPNLKVGYKYSYFGVFWLDFWTYDGEFCLYTTKEEGYSPIDKAVAAKLLNLSEDQLKAPFLYRFPLGMWIIISLGGLAVIVIVYSAVTKDKTASPSATSPDPSLDPNAPRDLGDDDDGDGDDEDDYDYKSANAQPHAPSPDLRAGAPATPLTPPIPRDLPADLPAAAPSTPPPAGPSSPHDPER